MHEVAIGMPHRGRLNTLVNVVRKPFTALFSEFGGASFKPDDVQGSGDVKYHLGTSTDIESGGHTVHISLQPNPSHLEAVDPVVVGKVRARQDAAGDTKARRSVMGILMHGDAAFAGQGLVYETLAMSQLIGYRTGGTIHVVVNNQIGFTTVPAHAYSGLYCTDVAKSMQAPILHVNGDKPEAVLFCSRLAAEFRQQFATDFVLDIVCYRRHGHNETDEPAFTQPIMYRAIRDMKTTRTLYADKLARRGRRAARPRPRRCGTGSGDARRELQGGAELQAQQGRLAGGPLARPEAADQEDETVGGRDRVDREPRAAQIGRALASVPDGFDAQPEDRPPVGGQARHDRDGRGHRLGDRRGAGVRRAAAGRHRVRLSGEDCQRGTFSQRHAVLVDQTNANEYVPLNNIAHGQAKIEIFNSLLSEAGRARLRIRLHAGRPDGRWCCGRRSSATSPTARR